APALGQAHVLRAEHTRKTLRRHKRIVRLQEGTHEKERFVSAEPAQKPDSFAGHEALEMVLFRNPRYAADMNRPFPIVEVSCASPRIAGIPPKVVDLWHAGAGVRTAQLVRVELGLRSQILIPVVEVEAIVEAMRLGIDEMHLADQ